MTNRLPGSSHVRDIREARSLFPATDSVAYFNTAAVGLASRALSVACHRYVDEWVETGLDYVRGEAAGESADNEREYPFLAKPVGPEALVATVREAIGRTEGR